VLYMGREGCGVNTTDRRRRGVVSSLLSRSKSLNHITTQEGYRHYIVSASWEAKLKNTTLHGPKPSYMNELAQPSPDVTITPSAGIH